MTSAVPWRRASLGPPRPQRPPPRRRGSVSAPHGAPLVLATLPPCLHHSAPSTTVPPGALAPEAWGTPAAKVLLVTGSLVPRLAQSCILGSMSSSRPPEHTMSGRIAGSEPAWEARPPSCHLGAPGGGRGACGRDSGGGGGGSWGLGPDPACGAPSPALPPQPSPR